MRSPSNSCRRARPLLGTLVEISASGAAGELATAVDQAFAAIERCHRLMSFHDAASDVSALNRDALERPVQVAAPTWEVLCQAQEIAAASDGAFDVSIAPRLVQWAYLPAPDRPLPPVKRHGYRAIELAGEGWVRFAEPLWIDLGGIAKGYAVDCACRVLERFGIVDYVVNAGGDLRVGHTATTIHLRLPRRPQLSLSAGTIRGQAIATSGAYFAAKRGPHGPVHPIVAPATNGPAAYRGSISVVADSCMLADALTKVVAILGPGAADVLRRFDAQACLLSEDGAFRALGPGTAAAAGLAPQ